MLTFTVWGLGIALGSHERVFLSWKTEIYVETKDAPLTCNRGRTVLRRVFFEVGRSYSPIYGFNGFCGAILTDRGFYKLPEDGDWLMAWGDARRAVLWDALEEGCWYEVRIRGWGKRLVPGDRPVAPIRQTISSVLDNLGCGETPRL